MSLRVELIHPAERRSASPVSGKSLLRIAVVLVPLIVVCALAVALVKGAELKSRARMLEARWAALEPKTKAAATLTEELRRNREILTEIDGWRKSRIVWHGQLQELMAIVPQEIQLRRLRASESLRLLPTEVPARSFTLALEGRAVGEASERNVEMLRESLQTGGAFTSLTQEVVIQGYAADTAKDAGRNDRVFSIDCTYRPRPFE